MRTTLFVDVLLPLPVAGYFTYRVPFELNDEIEPGKRVVVQFGKKKIYTALIRSVTDKSPAVETRYILGVLDIKPVVNETQFAFWEWMASYYCSTPGEVMNAALPSALKLASETKIRIVPNIGLNEKILSEKEFVLLSALQQNGALTITEASRFTELAKVIPLIHNLIEKGYIVTEEEIRERFVPKTINYVGITQEYATEAALQQLYDKLESKAPRQLELLIKYMQLSRLLSDVPVEVERKDLLAGLNGATTALSAMERKGIFTEYSREVSRLDFRKATHKPDAIQLSDEQTIALNTINQSFDSKPVTLLHGVTSSGKTEIYIKLIEKTIASGRQVLYLLPEIALTTQIINRLQKYFGADAGVYHSRYNEMERVEIWQHAGGSPDSQYKVILGARSAIFLPYSNLGLIIIDEEHDSSYKQYDPAPRYNARDAAIFLAKLHNAYYWVRQRLRWSHTIMPKLVNMGCPR
jgi:primosomal protein N' (replication factor Y)